MQLEGEPIRHAVEGGTARGGKWTHVKVGAVLRPFEQSAAVAVV
jgi:hypothetical protein